MATIASKRKREQSHLGSNKVTQSLEHNLKIVENCGSYNARRCKAIGDYWLFENEMKLLISDYLGFHFHKNKEKHFVLQVFGLFPISRPKFYKNIMQHIVLVILKEVKQ